MRWYPTMPAQTLTENRICTERRRIAWEFSPPRNGRYVCWIFLPFWRILHFAYWNWYSTFSWMSGMLIAPDTKKSLWKEHVSANSRWNLLKKLISSVYRSAYKRYTSGPLQSAVSYAKFISTNNMFVQVVILLNWSSCEIQFSAKRLEIFVQCHLQRQKSISDPEFLYDSRI